MENSSYLWQRALCDAMRETDAEKLTASLAAADDAVFYRLYELEGLEGCGEERLALEDAMEDVRLLRSQAFRFCV